MSITDDVAVEDLISRFAGQLSPADREAFHRAATAALPDCAGEDAAYRELVAVWRRYFRPPALAAAPAQAARGAAHGDRTAAVGSISI